jgi:hypothetical protein
VEAVPHAAREQDVLPVPALPPVLDAVQAQDALVAAVTVSSPAPDDSAAEVPVWPPEPAVPAAGLQASEPALAAPPEPGVPAAGPLAEGSAAEPAVVPLAPGSRRAD